MRPRWNLRPGILLKLSLMLVVASLGHAGATPIGSGAQSAAPTENKQPLKGSVSVHLALNPYAYAGKQLGVGVGTWGVSDTMAFEKELNIFQGDSQKAIAGSGLFSPTPQGDPDYVLDVWVDELDSHLKVLSAFMSDMTTVWRVTRVKDGKVLFCDFVDGHGSSRGAGGTGQRHSIENAMQETIHNGIVALADDWERHMPAIQLSVRPSMGSVAPEALQWIRQNWRRLRKGMSFDEISQILAPPMLPQGASPTHRIRTSGIRETSDSKATLNTHRGPVTITPPGLQSRFPNYPANTISCDIQFIMEGTPRVVTSIKKDTKSADLLYEEIADFLTIRTRIVTVESPSSLPSNLPFSFHSGALPEECFTKISPKGTCVASPPGFFTKWEDTQEYVTDAYQLTFLNGELTGGKLRQ